MSRRLAALITRVAAAVVAKLGQPRWGFVASVDPNRPAVRLLLQPENVLSGWLPVLFGGGAAGASGGQVPVVGAMACLIPDLGDAEHGIVVGFAHNDGAQLPAMPNAPGAGGTPNGTAAPLASAEWFAHAFGSTVRLCADGSVLIQPGGGTVHLDGNLTVNGFVQAAGEVTRGWGGDDRVGLGTHSHPQGTDSHGDTEANTGAPVAGS